MIREVFRSILVIIGLFLLNSSIAQGNLPLIGASFFKIKNHPNFVGYILSDSNNNFLIEDLNGKTFEFSKYQMRKVYLPHEIVVFENRKFHYQNKWVWSSSMGFGENHFSWDNSFQKIIGLRYELGVGVGVHVNSFSFATSTDWHFISVVSLPFYVEGKFNLIAKRKNRLYAKGAAGYANNVTTFTTPVVSDSFFGRFGMGIQFSSRNRYKQFIEFNQYISGASGEAINTSNNASSNIQFSNIWFTRFTFTYGIQIGK